MTAAHGATEISWFEAAAEADGATTEAPAACTRGKRTMNGSGGGGGSVEVKRKPLPLCSGQEVEGDYDVACCDVSDFTLCC